MVNVSKKVLGELRRQGDRPLPAWRFMAASAFKWLGFAVFALLGAQAVSVILFLLSGHDWTRLDRFSGGPAVYFLKSVPYVWLLLLAALLLAAYIDFRRTESGYRYRAFSVIAGLVAFSLVAGTGLYAAGLARRTDESLARHLPHYRAVAPRGIEMWDRPDDGRLVGLVESIDEAESTVNLRDPAGKDWQVILKDPAQAERVTVGQPARLFGKARGAGRFQAEEIMTWKPGFGRQKGQPLPPQLKGKGRNHRLKAY